MSAVFRRILVPTDFSEASDAAWQLARRLGGHDATLVALNVIAPLYPDVASSNVGAAMREQRVENEARLAVVAVAPRAEVRGIERRVVIGDPTEAIVETAREIGADVIVIGVHRRHGLEHFLRGSTAEHVVRAAPCDVLVVKAAA